MIIWGCMGWNGAGMLTKDEKRMDAKWYVEILDQYIAQSMEDLGIPLEKVIFQQDNDPKHTSKLAQTWFMDHGIHPFSIYGIFFSHLTSLSL